MTTVSHTDSPAEPPALLRRPGRFYNGYVFDLDGTVYLGDALLPGAALAAAALMQIVALRATRGV